MIKICYVYYIAKVGLSVVNITQIFSSLVYVEYSCTAGVNCKIGPQIWYTNGGGAIISHIGTLPNDVTLINITEWITTIKKPTEWFGISG